MWRPLNGRLGLCDHSPVEAAICRIWCDISERYIFTHTHTHTHTYININNDAKKTPIFIRWDVKLFSLTQR